MLLLALPAASGASAQVAVVSDHEIRLAQAGDQTITLPTPTVAPNLSGCQNTCIATVNGTTVIPSVTTAGVATTPNQCQSNCSAQQTQCQRGCALVQ